MPICDHRVFLQEVAMQAAASLTFRGVPTFFRCCCIEAERQINGLDYSTPGYHLTLHLRELSPYAAADGEWETAVEDLGTRIEEGDIDAVIHWFNEHYPLCMSLVPKRRRRKFAQGVFHCWIEREN